MKAVLVNIVGLLVDNRRVEFGSQFGTEVLLLECKKYDQDAIVISIDSGHTIALKLGEIKKRVMLCIVLLDKW